MIGIDECPVRGCRAHVPGVDAAEVHEGETFECARGHYLVGCVVNEVAWLVKVPQRATGRRAPEHRK